MKMPHTDDDNIQNQDGESNNSTTDAVLPLKLVAMILGGDRSCHSERQHGELEEYGESELEHDFGCRFYLL
jgi:hypothetical protein